MKLNQLSLAVAATLVASQAYALTPAQIDANTLRFWYSGASAPTASFYKSFRTLCKDTVAPIGTPDDLHVYMELAEDTNADGFVGEPGVDKSDRIAYACTLKGSGLTAGLHNKKVIVYHTVEGGSFNAYVPHLKLEGEINAFVGSSLGKLKAVSGLGVAGKCADGTVATDLTPFPPNAPLANEVWNYGSTTNNTGDTAYVACGKDTITFALNSSETAEPTLPQGGLSDTEYQINKANLGITKALSAIGSESNIFVGQAFGLLVNHKLYQALQYAQGINTTLALDGEACDGVYTPGACQPSLPRGAYTSLVKSDNYDISVPETYVDASALGADSSVALTLCKRVGTSGTQSASNLFFMDKPCATKSAFRPADNELTTFPTTPVGGGSVTFTSTTGGGNIKVTENSSTGGVKSCLNSAEAAGQYGIGVVSMENKNGVGSDTFAIVKLDGVSPNSDLKQRVNAAKGDYEFWYELVAFKGKSARTYANGRDLLDKTVGAMKNPALTDLTGLFLAGGSGLAEDNDKVSAYLRSTASPINSCNLITHK